ncbi:hypothetical protein ABPG77_004256 [Micractinium sp. CCAP 211/92]
MAAVICSLTALLRAPRPTGAAVVILVATTAVSLAWPLLQPSSYRRCRTPALSLLRLLLVLLPGGPLAGRARQGLAAARLPRLANTAWLFSASRIDLLLVTAIGWHLPLRVHLPLRAAKLVLLACLQLSALSHAELLSGPRVAGAVSTLNGCMGLLANVVLPGTSVAAPLDTNAQSAAAVLFAWAMVGWLLPSLLLLGLPKDAAEARLPPTPANSPLGDSMGDACTGPVAGRWTGAAAAALAAPSAAATWVEAALRGLVGRRRQQVPGGQDTLPAGLPLALRWVLCLQIVWLACRAAAPLPFAR